MSAEVITVRLAVGKRAYGTGSLIEKHGAWYGRWYLPSGKRIMRKLGAVKHGRAGLSKKEAQAKLLEMMLAEGAAAATAREPQSPTVAQLAAALEAKLGRKGRKRSHIENVRYHLRAHIVPLLGEEAADLVGGDDVQRLVDRLQRLGRSPKTIKNVVGTLHGALEIAVEQRVISSNPVRMADLPPDRREPAIRFLTQAELTRVIAAAPPPGAERMERDWWPTVRLMILTAALTGMRLGELSALCWDDLDLGAMKVRIRRSFVRGHYGTPKSRRSVRAVPLARQLVSELDDWHMRTRFNRDADLVFAGPYTGRPINRRPLAVFFKRALARADVRPVRFHDLRHTFATTAAASGKVSMRTLQEWMGHLDPQTTAIYTDYMPGEREAELLSEAFGTLGGAQMVPNSPIATYRETS